MIDDKKLITQLLGTDLIDPAGLKKGIEISEQQGVALYDVVIEQQLVDERSVVELASQILNVPCVHLDEHQLDEETARLIPAEVATNHNALPLKVLNENGQRVLQLAMTDPIDVMAMDEIAGHVDVDIRPVLAGPVDLKDAIDRVYGDDEDDLIVLSDDDVIELDEAEEEEAQEEAVISLSTGVRDSFELEESFQGSKARFEVSQAPFMGEGEGGLVDESSFSFEDAEPAVFSTDDDDEPGGDEPATMESEPVEDSDSWASMFEDADADARESNSGPAQQQPLRQDGIDDGDDPVSIEMRDRPSGGVLDAVDNSRDANEISRPAFSQHPAITGSNTDGTVVGTPAELGDWELDEDLEKSGTARLRTGPGQTADDSAPDDSAPTTGVGPPVDLDEQQTTDNYDQQATDDEPAINQTQIGVGTHDLDELQFDDPSADADTEDADDDTTKESSDPLAAKLRTALKKASAERNQDNPQAESAHEIDDEQTAAPPAEQEETKRSVAVAIPDSVDSDELLRALITLLIEQKVLSAADVTALIDDLH